MAQYRRQHFQSFGFRFKGDNPGGMRRSFAVCCQDAIDCARNVDRPVIVEDQVGRFRSFRRHVDANNVVCITALTACVDALAIPTPQLIHRNSKVDLEVARYVLAVPTLYLVEQRNGRADDIATLLSQQPAQPRIAHRGSPPVRGAVAEIFGDHTTELVAIEESHLSPGRPQPTPQFSTESCLAGAGQPGNPENAPR